MRVAVQQVIQTVSKVAEDRLSPREAVTILASLTREALPAARQLRREDPEVADSYRELVVAIGRELRRREAISDEPRHLHAVTEDLAKLHQALS